MTGKRSSKRVKASRENGSKSRGPVSPEGKGKVRLNALKDGLFTKEVVIESAGEQKEEFERIKEAIWEQVRPTTPLEVMLTADLVENWWRRRRVRRAEAEELRNRLEVFKRRDDLRQNDVVEALRVRLLYGLQKYQAALSQGSVDDTVELISELEDVRQQLASNSLGIRFLIESVSNIQDQAEEASEISQELVVMLLACGGFGNEKVLICVQLNAMNKRIASQEIAERQRRDAEKEKQTAKDARKEKRQEKRKKTIENELEFQLLVIKEMLARRKSASGKAAQTESPGSAETSSTKESAFDRETSRIQALLDALLRSEPRDQAGFVKAMGDLARGGGSDTEAERKLRDLALKVEANLATPKEMRAFVLGQAIGMVKRRLELREMVLTTIEQQERNERYMASMSPTENVADRFARAETTLERRMYRALGALIAMRATQEKAKSLPEPFSVSTAS